MLSNLIVITILVFIIWLVVISGSDPKRDQERQKVRRAALKHYKEQKANG